MTTFNEGDRVRVVSHCCTGAQVGDTGTVVRKYDGLRWYADKYEGRNDTTHPIVEDAYNQRFEKIEPEPTDEDAPPAPQEAPEAPVDVVEAPDYQASTIEAQKAEIGRLQDRLSAALLAAELALQDHASDISKISEFFAEKATEHELCSQYDAAVEEINLELKVELTPRDKDYTVTVYFRQEIQVAARDEDSAIAEARQAYNYGEGLSRYEESEEPDVEENTY